MAGPTGPEPARGPHARPEGVEPALPRTQEQMQGDVTSLLTQINDVDRSTPEGKDRAFDLQGELITVQTAMIVDLSTQVRDLAERLDTQPERRRSKRKITALVVAGSLAVGAVFGAGVSGGFSGGHAKKPIAVVKKNNKKPAATSGGATTVSSQAVFGSKLLTDFENEIKSLGAVASADAAQSHALASTSPNTSATTATKSSGAEKASDPSVARAEHARTVAQAVKLMHSTSATIDGNVRSIYDQAHPSQALDHGYGSESALRAEFQHIGVTDAIETFAFDTVNSPANLAQQYNALHGVQNDGQLPAGVTHEHALKFVENGLLNKGTNFSIIHPNGIFGDAGQRGENVFAAHNITLNGDKAVFKVEIPGMPALYFLISNDAQAINNVCFNNIYPIMQVTMPTPEQPAAHAPAQHAPETPQPKHHPKPHHPHHPRQPRAPRTPVTPVTPVTPTPPHNHHTPKVDTNTTPAGVPGENGGTGTTTPTTGPGQGPAGQTPNSTGFLPGENTPPNTSPTVPTPAPIETQPAPTPPSTPEQGHDGGPGQPTSGSSGTGTTVTGTPSVPTS